VLCLWNINLSIAVEGLGSARSSRLEISPARWNGVFELWGLVCRVVLGKFLAPRHGVGWTEQPRHFRRFLNSR